MPLISAIGRRSWNIRVLIGLIYLVLITGGITMVYPLILMVSGSVKGKLDAEDIEMVPRFLRDETTFFRRYLESKYDSLGGLNEAWGSDILHFKTIEQPAVVSARLLDEFDAFRCEAQFPARWYLLGHAGVPAHNLREFRTEIRLEAGNDLVRAGEILQTTFRSWTEIAPRNYGPARGMLVPTRILERTDQFKKRARVEDWIPLNLEAHWKIATLFPKYEKKIENYRQRTGVNAQSWDDVHLTPTLPQTTNEHIRANWETYVRQKVGFAFLRVDESAAPAFHAYLRQIHGDNLKRLNQSYGTQYQSFEEVPISPTQVFTGSGYVDYNRFIREQCPIDALSLDGPTFRYRDFLRKKFNNDIATARQAYGVAWESFDDAGLPVAAMDWRDYRKLKPELRKEFLVRNYDYVLDFLARHGRGFQNTAILIVLFLVTHLTVNPLAAYALSRFGLPSTYKVLLFCMATVAFPAEVMMIPSFLQLKEFGLLNTFWALVLPGLASGYSIFLLKGFFDSLPRELYESATIDGASEWTIFWNITMSLSKPILAVMALGSFTGAFGTFFYALIICPDEKMWTLMVWLYQLQTISGSQAINYAALCLSSIPTLLVFVFCQRIIMRGIVVPSEK